jgi:MFS family permease
MPLTGTVADRFDRRRVAVVAFAAEILCALTLLVYLTSDPSAIWPVYLIAALFGAVRSFAIPAVRSIPPLIGPDGGLPRIIPYYSATWQFSLIVGPVAGGFLLDVGTGAPYLASGSLFTLGTVLMATVRFHRPQDRSLAEQRPTWGHAFEGLRYIRRTPVVFGAISLDLFAVLFGGAIALLPAIADDRLGVGNVGYGWLRAAPGIGAVLVTVFLAVRPPQRHVGRLLLVCVGVFGAATIVLGVTRSFALAFVALLVASGADSVSVLIRATLVPMATRDDTRGRVMAVEGVFIGASNELGAFSSGVTGYLFGIGPAVVLGGGLTLAAVAVWWVAFPALRRVDRYREVVPQ